MTRIGIVGSRRYWNKQKVEKVIDLAINTFGKENICIVSGGANGADKLGKVVAIEKNLKYEEYNPAHTEHNRWSVKPVTFFNKPYKPGNFFERNTFISEACDYLVAFIPDGVTSNGTMDTVNKAKKLNKQFG